MRAGDNGGVTGESIRMTSTFNRTMAIVLGAVAALAVVLAIWTGDSTLAWVYPGAALLALFSWSALWRPYVEVGDAGVRVQNVTHHVDIPWEALVHVDTRRALTLHTAHGQYTAWSAPAPGFMAAMAASRRQANREARASGGAPGHGDLIGSDSGNAALVIRESWRTRLDSGQIEIGVADDTPVTRHWNLTWAAVEVALAVVTVWAIIVTA